MKTYMRKQVPTTILLHRLATYLQHKGWHEVPSSNPNAVIYHGPLDIYGKPLVAVLPAREDLEDAGRRVNDVVRMLASLEAKLPAQLIREIVDVKAARRGLARSTVAAAG